jgi:cation diffusion facilitator family transporter
MPLWIAFILARRPPSPRFTFGLGRVEDLAGVAIVLVILSSALVALWEAVDRLVHPSPITSLLAVALAGITGFAGNEVAAYIRIKTGRAIDSAALIADGYHARTDGLTSLAVVLGAAGVWAGFPKADPLVGILITGMIFGIVWQSAKAVLIRVLDGVEPSVVNELEHAAAHAKGVSHVESVRARWIGHRLHAEMTLAIDDALSVVESNRLSEAIRGHARGHLPALATLHVEVTPASSDGSANHRPETKAEHSH